MESNREVQKNLIVSRLRFILEVFLVFFGIFLFLLVPRLLIPSLINKDSIFYGPIYYAVRALAIFLAIPIFLYLSNFLFEMQEKNLIVEEKLSPSLSHLKLYIISEKNFKYQFLYGILILFLVFVPLDFLLYWLVPELLEYSGKALSSQATNSYLLAEYSIFIFSVIIIQICVSIYEETLTRGYLTTRGSDYFDKMSAVFISSLYFGLMHFAYFLLPVSRNYPIWFPFIWFLQTYTVAIMLSIFITKREWLFPVIFAHAVNNIISAHAVWNYLQGNDFMAISIVLYFPLLIISGILLIVQFKRIKAGIKTGFKELKNYFKASEKDGESKRDLYVRLIFDVVMGILIVLIGLFIFGI
ncbi:MAG: CPBP family intramembrane metalloprotease [Candidatus Lokiarchaeota archaeon]|nr:CPBP family intramembrane metalloprotease [Candidatus Lokiarchaeota archaeon]MBD3341802.1 CPBP family intramembrane metalloprotease [Candidatus Lokiarchaeota archaeon]